jgi:hypothetical protein
MDLLDRLVLAVTMVAGGAVVCWVGLSQRRGTLERNYVAGLRTSETLANDDAWRAAHDATATLTIAAGLVGVATGIIAFFVGDPTATLAVIGVGGTVVLGLVAGAAVKGQRIARSINRDGGGG